MWIAPFFWKGVPPRKLSMLYLVQDLKYLTRCISLITCTIILFGPFLHELQRVS